MTTKPLYKIIFLLLLLCFQGCSSNGFHLRKNVTLSSDYNTIYLDGLESKAELKGLLIDGLSEAGSQVIQNETLADSTIVFSKLEEGRRVVAYTSELVVREYLVFLKGEYSIRLKGAKTTDLVNKYRINIDRSYLYDPDFALGKVEEEKRVKLALYEEMTRLILLRLKYSTQD